MKTINWMNLFKHITIATSLIAIAACSGQQQTDEDLEVSEYDNQAGDNSDLGNDDAGEGNGQENFVDESDNQENYGNGENNYDENTNSDTEEEDLDEAAEDDELDATLNNSGGEGDLVSDNDLAGGNQYENQAQPVPVSTDDMTPAPAANPNSAPIPGGRVRYVVEGGAQVTNGPGGTVVLTLAQGDHPVTWEENGFFKMAEGYYISQDALSEQGVGRPMRGAMWSGSTNNSTAARPSAAPKPAAGGSDYSGYSY